VERSAVSVTNPATGSSVAGEVVGRDLPQAVRMTSAARKKAQAAR
jgi:hypothetical protein